MILDKSALKLVSVADGSLSIMSIGIRFLKRHIISVKSKSFDEGCSPENNTVKILHVHEILKCLDEGSPENNPIKMLHEILKLSFDKCSRENNQIKM